MREADASLGVRLGVTVRDCGPEGCVDGPGLQRETGLRQGPVALISVQPGRQLHAEFQPQVGEPGCWPPPRGGRASPGGAVDTGASPSTSSPDSPTSARKGNTGQS